MSGFEFLIANSGGAEIYSAFTTVVQASPSAIAVRAGATLRTYEQLLADVECYAAHLAPNQSGKTVYAAVLGTRSYETVCAILACLRQGYCVVPLDPGFAPEHLAYVAANVTLSHVVATSDSKAALDTLASTAPTLNVADDIATAEPTNPAHAAAGDDPAFVLYTSGTTGQPKGVVVPHRAVTARVAGYVTMPVRPDDVVLHASTLACDGGVFEIFLPLLNGASVAIVEGGTPSLSKIAATMSDHNVTVTPWYAGTFHMMVDAHIDAFETVRLCQAGGDVMSATHARKLLDRFPSITLVNGYGPTETFYNSTSHVVGKDDLTAGAIPIGTPLAADATHLLDADLNPVEPGALGQLAIGGACVALGYLGNSHATDRAFVADPNIDGAFLYLTGDTAIERPDGVLEFHGRVDRQIKLNGRRVEIDGVEEILRTQDSVQDAAVVLHDEAGQAKSLVAFIVPEPAHRDSETLVADLRQATGDDLHRDVFPRHVKICDAFPLTKTGKVDRKALLDLWIADQNADAQPNIKTGAIGQIWQDVIGCRAPRDGDTFFDLGGTSLQLIEAHSKIEDLLGFTFDIATMFETARLADLTQRLSDLKAARPGKSVASTSATGAHEPIAIVGMAARLPGVDSLDAFWNVTRAGESVIDHFDPTDAEDSFSPAERSADNYVPARSIIADADAFDPEFFGMRKRAAELTDPQARVFLETTHEALENAAIDPERTTARIGVFAGASMSTYLAHNLLPDRAAIEEFTSGFQLDYGLLPGNTGDGIATHVAYALGLKGPAIAINTACSTSLTAIAMACQSLRAGAADVAIAGGVSITFPQKRGYFYQEGGMASPDGRCRPFDADAAGTVFGHGAGAVVLKPLSQAQADGDFVHAVIHGVALNNDGADKMSYTAPSVEGQANVIRDALADAQISSAEVGYVECHGTATPLGDVIEAAGLKAAFGDQGEACWLGSAKANLGHLDAAAGVVGVIKTALALTHREIPPIAHFKSLNPRISFEGTTFQVPTQSVTWNEGIGSFAGVSSFGVGGTNAHAVLGPAPQRADVISAIDHKPLYLPLSAKSPEALVQLAQDLATDLSSRRADELPDVAHTLQHGRRVFDHRACVAAEDTTAAIASLRALEKSASATEDEAPDLVFMFPGQGAQYPGMGSGLYEADAEYRTWIDAGAERLEPILGQDLRPLILGQNLDADQSAKALRETWITQPALFLTEVALAKSFIAKGIVPARLIGHSVGEFSAAVIAGVMPFEDALRLIALRGRAMMDQPSGAMLAVRASVDELRPHLPETLDLAAQNAPKMQVVAGAHDDIEAFARVLEEQGIAAQHLHTSHAFHSRMMDPVRASLFEAASSMQLSAPRLPIYSTVTGVELDARTAVDPNYWADQARACVNFQAAISAATETKPAALLEIGPGRTLSTFAAQVLPRSSHRGIFHSLPDHARSVPDVNSVAATISNLWCIGYPIDWSLQGQPEGRKTPLPTYPFQRVRCWVEPPNSTSPSISPNASTQETIAVSEQSATPASREAILLPKIAELLSDLSGETISVSDAEASFLEFGFDSLFLGQVSQAIGRTFGVTIAFRRLLSDISTMNALAAHLAAEMPQDASVFATQVAEPEAPAPAAPMPQTAAAPSNVLPLPTMPTVAPAPLANAGLEGVLQAQLQTMQAVFAQQLQSVSGQVAVALVTPERQPAPAPTETPKPVQESKLAEAPKAIKFGRGPAVSASFFTDLQKQLIDDLADAYSDKFAKSKAHTQAHRGVHADPRTVSGFSQDWKELVFPVVSETSKGAYINDIDGNALVDLVNGFGQTAFGHSPEFVTEAMQKQMERGFPIGPQSDMAGPIAQKFADFVDHERVTFCNTGSEAVMAAMRIARAATGRDIIVTFDKDYHGQFDEVLVKGRPNGKAGAGLPIAPGIPRSSVSNMVVLPYGDDSALEWLRDNADTVAAVIVEPVQSRHPTLRPQDFVRSLRDITQATGSALVIDEVVTGFRVGPQGMQGVWGIKGDMATYGKVVGGGMPIGVLAGSAKFMDTLDGGQWQFGDKSCPETIPTFFAGTFVRHPLVLAAVDATLDHMAGAGSNLWEDTATRTEALVAQMRDALSARGMPDIIENYSSWFVLKASEHDTFAAMLYPLMRLQGVHVMDGFCSFLTTEHGEVECNAVLSAFENALDVLLATGVFGMAPAGDASVAALASDDAVSSLIPLTESQMEIWLRHQLGGDAAAAFNESVSLTLNGSLNVSALEDACAALVKRHDALRARFAKDGSGFEVQDAPAAIVEHVDVSLEADPAAALESFVAGDTAKPIALTEGLPLRLTLVKSGADQHVLVLTAHHIVADGWSFGVLLDDLIALYNAATKGQSAALVPAPSFARYAKTKVIDQAAEQKALDYWVEEFKNPADVPDLPLDRPRPEQKSYSGDTLVHRMAPGLLETLKKSGGKQGCTLFVSTYAATQMFLSQLSTSRNIVLGVPYAAQQELANTEMVGHCVQFLPIQAEIAQDATVAEHLQHARDKVMSAFDHAGTTFGSIVQALRPQTPFNRLPLTEVEFNLETRASAYGFDGLQTQVSSNAKKAVNFDLFFNLAETPEGLILELHYNTSLFDRSTVAAWAEAYEHTLSTMFDDAQRRVCDVNIWPNPPTAATVEAAAYDRDATLWDALAPQFAANAEKVALADHQTALTFQQLNDDISALAAHIQKQCRAPKSRIAVCVPRGVSMATAMLAVSRAGHTYIPLDPNQPAARLADIVKTAKASAVLVTDIADAAFAKETPAIVMQDATAGAAPDPVMVSSEEAAYVIFTSGSTGTPKGVEISHRSLVNFLTSMAQAPGLTRDDRLLAVTTAMFDIAILEMFLPLFVGATVEIARTEDVVDTFKLTKRLQKGDVTCMQATPTLWDMVLSTGYVPSQGFKALCGGEPLASDLAAKIIGSGAELWNMYGPTETTIWSSIKRIDDANAITVGAPIANTEMVILSDAGAVMPTGQMGELNIGGDGLALGYLDRPDLTDAAFRTVQINGQPRRLYKTGDLARQLPNGEVEVLGRIDTQVKLRGYRIELGEIETNLRALAEIEKAAVDLRESASGDKALVGYIVPAQGAEVRTTSIAQKLSETLPDYMVPRAWVTLEALPQTANGKLDRKALPAPAAAGTVTRLRDHVAPASKTEIRIADIWKDVLCQQDIGITDTIFALGADSLSIFRIAARMIDEGLDLEARHVIAHPTIQELAAFHDAKGDDPKTTQRPSLSAFRGGARRGLRTGRQS